MSSPLERVPALATDTHAHLFDPVRFPYSPTRRYTPSPATTRDLLAMHERLGIERVVLVQPSVYGFDNACLLDGLRALGARARGVAVVPESAEREELARLFDAGVRGVRINLMVADPNRPSACNERLARLDAQLDELPMFIQLYASCETIVSCGKTIGAMRRPVLLDHFGLSPTGGTEVAPGAGALLDVLSNIHVWIKLSGPHQISADAPAFGDVVAVARALHHAAPDRTVWGSDWPHTAGMARALGSRPFDPEPFRPVDDAAELAMLSTWILDKADRDRVLVDNPARLFDF